jgi:hypothetical protein
MRSESCVPVGERVVGSGDVGVKQVGGFQAATLEYRGAENIQRTYDELYGWLHAQGYHDDGAPMETFWSRPSEPLHAEIAVPIVRMEKPTAVSNQTTPDAKKATAKKPARARIKNKTRHKEALNE